MKTDSESYFHQLFEKAILSAKPEIKEFVKIFPIRELNNASDFSSIEKMIFEMYQEIYTAYAASSVSYVPFYCENKKIILQFFLRRCKEASNPDNEVGILRYCYLLHRRREHVNKYYKYLRKVQIESQSSQINMSSGIFDCFFRLLQNWPPDFIRTRRALDEEVKNSLKNTIQPQLSKKEISDHILEINIDFFKFCLSYHSDKFRYLPSYESLLYIEKTLDDYNHYELTQSMDNEQLDKWHLLSKKFLENEKNSIKNFEIIYDKKSNQDAINIKKAKEAPEVDSWKLKNFGDAKKTPMPIHNAFTYKNYKGDDTVFNDMLISLKNKGFISMDTKKSDFRKIFFNTKPKKAIQWMAGIESLTYFIKLLHHHHKLIENIRPSIYDVAAAIFVDENKKPFERARFDHQGVPSKANLLMIAIEHLT